MSRASSSLVVHRGVGQGDGDWIEHRFEQSDDGGGLRGRNAVDEFVGLLLWVGYGVSHEKSFLSKVTVPAASAALPAGEYAVEDLLNNLLGLRIEARNGLELEFEGVVRAALVLIEKQLIRSYSEDYGHVADDIEGGLRDAPFVAF